jgi:hypothetical protein
VRLRVLLVLLVAAGCSESFTVDSSVSQAGGELIMRGDFGDRRDVVVLVDGVATTATVFESSTCVRVRVPPLPRSGPVPVQLVFADGEQIQIDGALHVSAPPIEIRD